MKKKYVAIINNINQITLHSSTMNTPVGKEYSTNSKYKQSSSNQTRQILGKNIHSSSVRLPLMKGFWSGTTHPDDKVPFQKRDRYFSHMHMRWVPHPAYS